MCPKKKTNRPVSYWYAKTCVVLDLKIYLGLLLQDHTYTLDELMPLKLQKLKVTSYGVFKKHFNLKME